MQQDVSIRITNSRHFALRRPCLSPSEVYRSPLNRFSGTNIGAAIIDQLVRPLRKKSNLDGLDTVA